MPDTNLNVPGLTAELCWETRMIGFAVWECNLVETETGLRFCILLGESSYREDKAFCSLFGLCL